MTRGFLEVEQILQDEFAVGEGLWSPDNAGFIGSDGTARVKEAPILRPGSTHGHLDKPINSRGSALLHSCWLCQVVSARTRRFLGAPQVT